jgi:hypothetical protein
LLDGLHTLGSLKPNACHPSLDEMRYSTTT